MILKDKHERTIRRSEYLHLISQNLFAKCILSNRLSSSQASPRVAVNSHSANTDYLKISNQVTSLELCSLVTRHIPYSAVVTEGYNFMGTA